jgi:hypothetical protein
MLLSFVVRTSDKAKSWSNLLDVSHFCNKLKWLCIPINIAANNKAKKPNFQILTNASLPLSLLL